MRYYIDTCIWLNLLKKEGDPAKGVPYWKIAQDFLERVLFFGHEVAYSGIILRELQIHLGDGEYPNARLYIEGLKLMRLNVSDEDKAMARQWESQCGFRISFYDLVHVALCKRNDCVLITRDKLLIDISQTKGVRACKPEQS